MKSIMGENVAEITYNVKYEAAYDSNNNNNLTKSTVNGSAGPHISAMQSKKKVTMIPK